MLWLLFLSSLVFAEDCISTSPLYDEYLQDVYTPMELEGESPVNYDSEKYFPYLEDLRNVVSCQKTTSGINSSYKLTYKNGDGAILKLANNAKRGEFGDWDRVTHEEAVQKLAYAWGNTSVPPVKTIEFRETDLVHLNLSMKSQKCLKSIKKAMSKFKIQQKVPASLALLIPDAIDLGDELSIESMYARPMYHNYLIKNKMRLDRQKGDHLFRLIATKVFKQYTLEHLGNNFQFLAVPSRVYAENPPLFRRMARGVEHLHYKQNYRLPDAHLLDYLTFNCDRDTFNNNIEDKYQNRYLIDNSNAFMTFKQLKFMRKDTGAFEYCEEIFDKVTKMKEVPCGDDLLIGFHENGKLNSMSPNQFNKLAKAQLADLKHLKEKGRITYEMGIRFRKLRQRYRQCRQSGEL